MWVDIPRKRTHDSVDGQNNKRNHDSVDGQNSNMLISG